VTRTTRVTTLDLLALGSVLLAALLGWSSLALAHLGHHSLPGVLVTTAVAFTAVVLGVRRWARPEVVADHRGTAVALGCAIVALAFTVPGFSYGVADKDPGVYVSHAVSIARTGDYVVHDTLLAHNAADPTFPLRLVSPGARFPGIWVHDAAAGFDVPQFYHLWPALLATADDAGGVRGMRLVTPLAGALCVLLLCALLRRIGDLLGVGKSVELVGGLLLATNAMQVWQARYPTTETLSEALFLGTLLGIVVAIQSGWAPAAGLSGLLVGIGFLNRADGVLLVLVSAGLGAALLALRRWDARAWWFAGGLSLVLPHALVQAYVLAKGYSLGNGVPALRTVAVLGLGALAAGLALGRLLHAPLARVQETLLTRRPQLVVGALVVLGVIGLIGLGFLRPRLFGADYMNYNGQVIRSYDEQNLRRLSWFLTLPAFAVIPVGVGVAAVRRWNAAVWAVVLPTLLLFPIYAYASRNSSRLMWWTRRYVPTVLPGVVILLALAFGLALVWRWRGSTWLRGPALLAAAALVATFVHQSWPIRRHEEFSGTFVVSGQIAALSHGQRGIYLWQPDIGCCTGATHLFPTTVWLQHGQECALLADVDPMGMIARYRKAFPGDPVFVVTGQNALPAGVDASAVNRVMDLRTATTVWDESDTTRPRGSHLVPLHVQVWHVMGTGRAGT
jgi:hypothetical protein